MAELLCSILLVSCAPDTTPPEDPPAVVRLLEAPEGTRVEVPDLGAARPPAWMESAELGRMPAPGWISRIPMFAGPANRDSRAALLAPAGTTYGFPVEAPAGARLVTALGFPILDSALGGTFRFRVSWTEGDAPPRTVLDREVTVEEGSGWIPVDVDLGLRRSRSIRLELSTEGRGGALWAGWAQPEIRPPGGRVVADPAPLDVLLVVIDTLRADRLGGWGHDRPTSPRLDRFSRRGTRFLRAFAPAPWTRPSHRSLFSGLLPLSRAGLESPPLPLLFHRRGFRTRAITGGGQIDYRFGFHTGFERFEVRDWLHEPEQVLRHLREGEGRSDFLFLHTYEVHDPYDHDEFARDLPAGRLGPGFSQEDWKELGKALTPDEQRYVSALYDSGIAHTDRQLGALLERLEEEGLLDSAIVVVTSDHGEQLFEQGSWRHGAWLWQNQTHVPLILTIPEPLVASLGIEGGRLPATVTSPVRLIDLYPTLLDLAGIPHRHEIQGRSLLPLLAGREERTREAFAENTNGAMERKALLDDRWKLVLSVPRGMPITSPEAESLLFHVGRDPTEQQDLGDRFPRRSRQLARRIRTMASGAADPEPEVPEDLPADLAESLEALGYLGN